MQFYSYTEMQKCSFTVLKEIETYVEAEVFSPDVFLIALTQYKILQSGISVNIIFVWFSFCFLFCSSGFFGGPGGGFGGFPVGSRSSGKATTATTKKNATKTTTRTTKNRKSKTKTKQQLNKNTAYRYPCLT